MPVFLSYRSSHSFEPISIPSGRALVPWAGASQTFYHFIDSIEVESYPWNRSKHYLVRTKSQAAGRRSAAGNGAAIRADSFVRVTSRRLCL